MLCPHLSQIHLELFGNEHRDRGVRALPHLDIGHRQDDLAVQYFNERTGVRLDDTTDPSEIENFPPMSPPVSVPVLEWQAAQKLSVIALPRRICSGVPATFRSGSGALRTFNRYSPTTMTDA